MASYNFPDSPSNADTVTVNGITYTYNSTKGYWTSSAGSSGSGGGASVSTSDSAPSSPSDGDLWYDTDDGGMFVYYADGSSNQWVEVIGQQGAAGAAGAAGADGSATVVANVTALLALSSPAAGDQAFVTATNTLYFYNGSGWYKIALINTNPSISGANATYDLAIDGTATTVTIVATDPEGIPITYSIASDTSGNIATVAQGTGASTNVWTITPSTNTAHAGTFSLTFRASDGVNIATAASSFTLQFKVVNSKYTTALITSVGANNATNVSFDDKSTNNHTITANGDIHQTTFSPYRHGGYSVEFDGTGDYLETPTDTSSFQVGTGQFTLECWFQVNADAQYTLLALMSGSTNVMNIFYYHTNDSIGIVDSDWLTGNVGSGTNHDIIDLNKWYHLALVRDASTLYLYIDGALKYSASNSTNYANNRIRIGNHQYGNNLNGYIRDVRFVKGTAVYTSAFTAPTEPLTAVTNTKLLTCHLPYIADGSTDGHAITVAGDPTIEPISPYDAQEYSAASHLGSASFDGTGDYLSVAASSDFDLGTSDFTIEGWVYFSSYTSSNNFIVGQNYFASVFQLNGSGYLQFYSSPASAYIITGSTAIPTNTWTHIALVRNGNAWTIYLNGKSDATATNAADAGYNSTNPLTIGYWNSTASNFVGNISDLRFVKGTAVYTAEFTPPTAPLTAVTNTKLLVQSTDAGIIDKSQTTKKVQLFADTKSSTAQYKFLSSSIYFDGTGDYLKTSSSGNFLAEGPWTQEMWLRLAGTGAGQQIGPAFGGGTAGWNSSTGHQWLLYTHSSAGFVAQYYGTNNTHNTITIASSAPFTANTWHHWAISWDGTTLRFFMDGTSVHTTTSFIPNTMTATHTELGRMPDNSYYSQAYYSDVRITKGLARYTANFTAPTAALKG